MQLDHVFGDKSRVHWEPHDHWLVIRLRLTCSRSGHVFIHKPRVLWHVTCSFIYHVFIETTREHWCESREMMRVSHVLIGTSRDCWHHVIVSRGLKVHILESWLQELLARPSHNAWLDRLIHTVNTVTNTLTVRAVLDWLLSSIFLPVFGTTTRNQEV